MKKLVFVLFLLMVSVSLCVSAADGFGQPSEVAYMQTAESRLKLRSAPSRSAKVLGQYYEGTDLEILSVNKPWAKVSIHGTVGYMQINYLRDAVLDSPPFLSEMQGVLIPSEGGGLSLRLFASPADDAEVLADTQPESIDVLGTCGDDFVHVGVHRNGQVQYGFAKSNRIAWKDLHGEKRYVITDRADQLIHLRAAPKKSATSLCRVYPGASVYRLFDDHLADDGWTKVRLGPMVGYMMDDYLTDQRYEGEYLPAQLGLTDNVPLYESAAARKATESVYASDPSFVIAATKERYLVRTETWLTEDTYGDRYGFVSRSDVPLPVSASIPRKARMLSDTVLYDSSLQPIPKKAFYRSFLVTILGCSDAENANAREDYILDGSSFLLVKSLGADDSVNNIYFVPMDTVDFDEGLLLSPNASNG